MEPDWPSERSLDSIVKGQPLRANLLLPGIKA
jgi:hypothetical protein